MMIGSSSQYCREPQSTTFNGEFVSEWNESRIGSASTELLVLLSREKDFVDRLAVAFPGCLSICFLSRDAGADLDLEGVSCEGRRSIIDRVPSRPSSMLALRTMPASEDPLIDERLMLL